MVDRQRVRLEWENRDKLQRDRFGRLLAYIFVGDKNINIEMVRLGHSKFYTKYGKGRYAKDFMAAEKEARTPGLIRVPERGDN